MKERKVYISLTWPEMTKSIAFSHAINQFLLFLTPTPWLELVLTATSFIGQNSIILVGK